MITALPTRADVERFRTVVTDRLGLVHDDSKLETLADVLRARLDATGSHGLDAYLARLDGPDRAVELRALAQQLTVGETFFFRNADQFRALTESVLPARIRAATSRRLRLLSIGCATGDEPHSLAILAREAVPDLASWDIQVVGVDVNAASLARARAGRYSAWALRATPDAVKARYFVTEGREHVLDPAVRAMVRFVECNLADERAPASGWADERYDLVLWRNVLMYLAPALTRRLLVRVHDALLPGGYLLLGHAESLRGLSDDFHLCHTHDTFYYQRKDGPGARPVAAPGAPANAGPAIAPDSSWVDVIARASARITDLTTDRGVSAAPGQRARGGADADADAAAQLDEVRELSRLERFDEALARLGTLPDAARAAPEALMLRAALLTNGGRLDEAQAVCARLLELAELDAGAHYLMALCREHAGDRAAAIDHAQIASYLDPHFAMPQLHLGLLLKRDGDHASAQRALTQALTLLPQEETARLAMFGGGFSRATLLALCEGELRALGAAR